MYRQKMTRKEVANEATNKMLDGTTPSSNKSDSRFRWFITSSCFAGLMIAVVAIMSGNVTGPRYSLVESSTSENNINGMRNVVPFEESERFAQESFTESNPEQIESSSEVETLDVEETSEIEWVWYAPEWYESTRMSYMDYRTITCEGTLQWELQNDGWTSTDPNTGIRMRGGRYMIALGQTFGLTGTKVDVHLQNGASIPCILGDSKEWCDTLDGEGVIGADTGTVEFIVEEELLPDDVIELGSNELQFNGYWQSPVSYIEVLAD